MSQKMVAIFGGLCTESLWRGYHFATLRNPKVRHICNHPMQMRMFCLTFRFFGWFLYIPGELVLDDCIYASPERFLDFL